MQLILSNLQNIEYFSLVEIQSMNKENLFTECKKCGDRHKQLVNHRGLRMIKKVFEEVILS